MSPEDKAAAVAKLHKSYAQYVYNSEVLKASLIALQGILANPVEHPEWRLDGETCEAANARLAIIQGKAFVDQFAHWKSLEK